MPNLPKKSKNRAANSIADALFKHTGLTPPVLMDLPDDPWVFVRECCYSQDEHAKAKGLPYIYKLVGDGDDYLKVITEAVETEQRLRIEKSRQLRVTWLLCALLLHRILKQPGARIAYQAKKYDDANAYLQDRFWFIYEHIPACYKKPRARYVDGAIEVHHDDNSFSPTARIQAIAEGPEQVRQFTFTIWWADEFGFQDKQQESLTASQPSLDGGGQGIITSSAAGDQNQFYKLGHVDVTPGEHTAPSLLMQGVSRWRRNGWTTLKVHYTADPHKRGDWAATAKTGYTSQAWQQEHEIDFTITPGTPIFDATNLIVKEQFIEKMTVVSGMDYSYLANYCVMGQIRKRADSMYSLHILAEVLTESTYIRPFAEKVLEVRAATFPKMEFRDYGDYSANQHSSTGTIIDEMQAAGITLVTVPTGPGGVQLGLNLFQRLIDLGLLEVDPSCVLFLKMVRAGYVWSGKVDAKGMPIPSPEHPMADIADAGRYLIRNCFDLHQIAGGGYTVLVKDQFRGSGTMRAAATAPPKPWAYNIPLEPNSQTQGTVIQPPGGWRGSGTGRKGDDGGGVFRG